MSIQDCVQLLLALKNIQKLREFVQKKGIFLSLDKTSKSFTLHAKVFSDDSYVPPSLREFVAAASFKETYPTFLRIDPKTAEIHLVQQIPFHEHSLRYLFVQFSELAQKTITILNEKADQELLLVKKRSRFL